MDFSSLFIPKAPPLVGLDISSTAVKLLELGKNGDRFRVVIHQQEPAPERAGGRARRAAPGEEVEDAVART